MKQNKRVNFKARMRLIKHKKPIEKVLDFLVFSIVIATILYNLYILLT